MNKQQSQGHYLQKFWKIAGGVRIRVKFLGLALGMVILIGLGNTVLTRMVLSTHLENQLYEQSIMVTRDVAAKATDQILLNNQLGLQDLLLEAKNNNDNILYAFIQNSQGEVIAHTFGDGFPIKLLEINQLKEMLNQQTKLIQSNDGLVYDTVVPILGGKIGIARVGLSNGKVEKAINTATLQSFIFLVISLFFAGFIALILTKILSRPILDLDAATRSISKGDYSIRVHPWANDELGNLAQAFNQMSSDLSQIHDLRLERELLQRQLLEKTITTQESERQQIARDLHDSTSQSLTSLIIGLRTLELSCACGDEEKLRNLRVIASEALEEIHDLVARLRPRLLDDLGLPAAIETLTRDWQSHYKIPVDAMIILGDLRLSENVETALYRIIQESLTNIARHSQAKSVSLLVERRKNTIITVIEDDGIGFDMSANSSDRQLGLLGMRERTELLNGTMKIESEPGSGTSIYIEIPICVKKE